MHRQTTDRPLTCTTCELEIAGRPEFHAGLAFCCAGCVVGGPCLCSYDLFEDVMRAVEAADAGTFGRAVPSVEPRPEPALAGMLRD